MTENAVGCDGRVMRLDIGCPTVKNQITWTNGKVVSHQQPKRQSCGEHKCRESKKARIGAHLEMTLTFRPGTGVSSSNVYGE